VFLEINGHYMFIFALRDLFGLVPVGGATQLPMDFETLATLSAGLFGAAVRMVFPVIAALLLADLGLALLARVAPQLNLFALGLPLKVGVAYGALVLALPWIMPQMIGMFRAIPENMLALAR
jgi:flagellar biosynthetic protein FliR